MMDGVVLNCTKANYFFAVTYIGVDIPFVVRHIRAGAMNMISLMGSQLESFATGLVYIEYLLVLIFPCSEFAEDESSLPFFSFPEFPYCKYCVQVWIPRGRIFLGLRDLLRIAC